MTSIDNITLADQLNDLLLEMKEAGIDTDIFYAITLTKTDGQLRLQGDSFRIKSTKYELRSIGFKALGEDFFVRKNVTLILA